MAQSNRDKCVAKLSQINGHLQAIRVALAFIASLQDQDKDIEIITYCFLIDQIIEQAKEDVLPQLSELI